MKRDRPKVLVDQDAFRAAARVGQGVGLGLSRSGRVLRTPDDGSRVVRFIFSDGSIDRMGDRIDPNGWDVDEFMRNPIALFAHDASAPPIGRAVSVWSDGTRLLGDIKFAPPEVYEFADTVFKLVKGGFLNAVSVGFLPTEWNFVENDPDRGWGIDFKRQQLLEISVVPVPANSNALIEARAKGIITQSDMQRFRGHRGTRAGASAADATSGAAGAARLRELKARLSGPAKNVGAEDDTWAEWVAGKRRRIASIRARHDLSPTDPRIIAAEAAFRFRQW